jgi:peptidoglycan/xylan/chitin deacetylase (PgdA/CDA1 family)
MRRGLKQAATALGSRIAPAAEPAGRRLVLCYHSVSRSPSYLSLTPELFDAQLDWLARNTHVVPLRDLIAGRNRVDAPQVAITFDDGYADNHTHALPRLWARGMTATFFLTAGFIERDPEVMSGLADTWRRPLEELTPLSWTQVEEMRSAGMGVGSHTWSHRNLATIGGAAVDQELSRSKHVLEDRLSVPVSAVAFPWGKPRRHVTDDIFAAAGRAGYELAVFSLPRALRDTDPPLRIPRFGIGAEPVESVAGKVRGEIDWHAAVHERLPAPLARALWPEDGRRDGVA